jgi:hypothetical protein
MITTDTDTLLSVFGEHDRLPHAMDTTMAVDGDQRVVQQLVNGIAVPDPASMDTRR